MSRFESDQSAISLQLTAPGLPQRRIRPWREAQNRYLSPQPAPAILPRSVG